MAKQRAPIEINNLSGGLITEANALTFPDSASIDEDNFELRRDGSRVRRYGIELEEGNLPYNTGIVYSQGPTVVSSYLWENVAGSNNINYLVVQYNENLVFYKTEDSLISSNRIDYIFSAEASVKTNLFGFATVDGKLVVATGGKKIYTIEADTSSTGAPTFTVTQSPLEIRDLFGVPVDYNVNVEIAGQSGVNYIDLSDPAYSTKRPLSAGLGAEDDTETPAEFTGWAYAFSETVDLNTAYNPFIPSSYQGYSLNRIILNKWQNPDSIQLYFNSTPTFTNISMTFEGASKTVYAQLSRSSSNSKLYIGYISSGDYQQVEDHVTSGGGAPAYGWLDFTMSTVVATTAKSTYIYNLRNQSFAAKRFEKTGTTLEDPIVSFIEKSGDRYPSMGDSVVAALYNNSEDSTNKTVDRFHAQDLVANPQGSYQAPKGYFIIDALNRSESRTQRWEELVQDQGYSSNEVVELIPDSTPGGAKVIAEYGGRIWYGGFSELGEDASSYKIRLESYLLYSQLSNSTAALTRCYQEGDPTSVESPELLDTDGGFLSLDGAYGISKLVPLGNSLIVFSENGVWSVTGNDGNYFTPTSPRIQKITDRGSLSTQAVVVVDTSVIYWAKDGIYLIGVSQTGSYEVHNLTEKTIQTFYANIPYTDKKKVVGNYDSHNSLVVWSVYNTINHTEETFELQLLTTTGAFTVHTIKDGSTERSLIGPVKVPPYTLKSVDAIVAVDLDEVMVDTDTVTMSDIEIEPRTVELKYLTIENLSNYSNISFAAFTNTDYLDWGEVDAAAYIVTGYVSGGDFQRYKQTPYITFHMERTEEGFELDVDGNIIPTHQSSCYMQAQWDWSNSAKSGKWGNPIQVYRYKKYYIPEDINDTYDYGFSTIVTKNKIRGRGKVLSLKLTTEEGKDCRILGWSALMEVDNYV